MQQAVGVVYGVRKIEATNSYREPFNSVMHFAIETAVCIMCKLRILRNKDVDFPTTLPSEAVFVETKNWVLATNGTCSLDHRLGVSGLDRTHSASKEVVV